MKELAAVLGRLPPDAPVLVVDQAGLKVCIHEAQVQVGPGPGGGVVPRFLELHVKRPARGGRPRCSPRA